MNEPLDTDYRLAGFNRSVGLGTRPTVVIVDMGSRLLRSLMCRRAQMTPITSCDQRRKVTHYAPLFK